MLVHDAARPFLRREHIVRLIAATEAADGAILAAPLADTIKRPVEGELQTPPREGLWRAQTPQAFRRGALAAAYAAWPAGSEPTDDALAFTKWLRREDAPADSLAELHYAVFGLGDRSYEKYCAMGPPAAHGLSVALAAGDPMLMKLTYPEDFDMAERLAGAARITRTGMGYDAHRWGPGEAVWLCGVRIDHDQTLIGHSDADAGLHAITDAVLGAIGDGDIGEHFPPSDPQWRGAPSDRFLAHAAERVRARGGRIVNVDVTLICERPKIRPHRDAMRARIAEILDLPLDRVSVKATTTEGMGFTGRQEGLAAQAVASVETPA